MSTRVRRSWDVIGLLCVAVLLGIGGVWTLAAQAPQPQDATSTDIVRQMVSPPQESIPPTVEPLHQPTFRIKPFVPTHVSVPIIGLKAKVVSVGRASDGSQDVPPSGAGWNKLGPKPGETRGNVVLVGHSKLDGTGAFNHLGQLKEGDLVSLSGGSNEATYEVTLIQVVSKTKYDSVRDDIYDFSHQPQLVLMTCSGKWDTRRRTHADWTIVYATATT